VDAILGWFDLNPTIGGDVIVAAGGAAISPLEQAVLYGLVVAGVLLSESIAVARKGQAISLDLRWSWVATACLIALIVFPAVWRSIGSMPDAGLIVQMGLAAQGGAFWGVLMAGVQKQAQA
jgi:hypothetical protein